MSGVDLTGMDIKSTGQNWPAHVRGFGARTFKLWTECKGQTSKKVDYAAAEDA